MKVKKEIIAWEDPVTRLYQVTGISKMLTKSEVDALFAAFPEVDKRFITWIKPDRFHWDYEKQENAPNDTKQE